MPTKLAADILKYSDNALKFQTAAETLNALDDIVREHCHIRVLGAVLMPAVYGDTEGIELGKTAFLHRSVPKGWWDEYMMRAVASYSGRLLREHSRATTPSIV